MVVLRVSMRRGLQEACARWRLQVGMLAGPAAAAGQGACNAARRLASAGALACIPSAANPLPSSAHRVFYDGGQLGVEGQLLQVRAAVFRLHGCRARPDLTEGYRPRLCGHRGRPGLTACLQSSTAPAAPVHAHSAA